ncbi:MAG: phosphoribosylanthranilate isomerase [Gammaproteobacteria bacterium]|nr:phosphoribosylanthranilate isomerase [Gammaproteobacteria bacterium]
MRVRIKFCGITRAEDAAAAAAAGADAIGVVFFRDSPRHVTPDQAHAVCAALPPFVTRVGLFVDPDAESVRQVLKSVPLDMLQFHGAEPAAFCTAFGVPYLKAVRVRDPGDIVQAGRAHPAAAALLLDSCVPGRPGGTGVVFSWAMIPAQREHPIILAGGLGPENVQAAIAAVRPYAVDVSGGIEARPGIKDPAKMQRFVAAVHAACG